MAKRTAEVEVKVTGAEEAAEKAKKVKDAWSEAADKPGEKWKKLGETIASSVEGFVSDLSRAINIANGLNFAKAIDSARNYQLQVGRTAAYTGQSIKEIEQRFERLSRQKLIKEEEGLAYARTLTRMTYDATGAQKALGGLADEAVATGRSADEMLPLGATLHNVLGVSGDTSEALKNIRGQAEALGVAGGPAVLEDSIVSLTGALSGFSSKSDEARGKLTGLLATMQGMSTDPQHGARAFAGYSGAIQSQALLVSRFLGRKTSSLYDEEGKLKPEVLSDVQQKWFQTYGRGERSFERAVNTFGPEAAAEFFHKDFSRVPTSAAPTKTAGQIASDFYQTDAADRERKRQEAERNARKSAASALPALDTLNGIAAQHPFLATLGIGVGGSLLSKAAGGLIRSGFKAAFRGIGGSAAEGAAAEGAAAGGAAAGGGALGALAGGLLSGAAIPLAGLFGVGSVISGQQAQTRNTIADFNEEHPADAEAAKYFGTEYAREHKAQIRHGGMQIINDTPFGPDPESRPQHEAGAPAQGLAAFVQSVDGLTKVFQQNQQQPIVVQVLNATGGPVEAVVSQRGQAAKQ